MMDRKREMALENWCRGVLNDNTIKLAPASSDASFRSYYRLSSRDNTFIVMDAPPDGDGGDRTHPRLHPDGRPRR